VGRKKGSICSNNKVEKVGVEIGKGVGGRGEGERLSIFAVLHFLSLIIISPIPPYPPVSPSID
jgi:hypothetical protein